MKTTTLNRIRLHSPCLDSWEKLLNVLGKTQFDDDPLAYAKILEICGLSDALLATSAEPQYNWRLLTVAFARRVQHLNPDPRVKNAIDVAERYANGQATDEELAEARKASLGARAAGGFIPAARAAAWAAAGAAASDADKDDCAAASDACEATGAAADPAWESACAAERKEQEKLFIEFVSQ